MEWEIIILPRTGPGVEGGKGEGRKRGKGEGGRGEEEREGERMKRRQREGKVAEGGRGEGREEGEGGGKGVLFLNNTLPLHIQWNPSKPATLGTSESVLIRGVTTFQG